MDPNYLTVSQFREQLYDEMMNLKIQTMAQAEFPVHEIKEIFQFINCSLMSGRSADDGCTEAKPSISVSNF